VTVFRIAKQRFIEDTTGEGARLYGGRWNRKGTPVVYAAANRALATVEFLVHLPLSLLPSDIWIAELSFPDDITVEEILPESLPDDWSTYPPPSILAALGDAWARRNESLVLRVPSAVVKGEFNYLINPRHTRSFEVRIVAAEPMRIDR
jgi:RES domain-containing protein